MHIASVMLNRTACDSYHHNIPLHCPPPKINGYLQTLDMDTFVPPKQLHRRPKEADSGSSNAVITIAPYRA